MRIIPLALMFGVWANCLSAGPCDYRPSELIGGGGATAIGSGGAAAAGFGLAIKGVGFYTLTHSTSGAIMVGSTLAGTSAAGTVGIIGGTGGVIGTATAVATAPVTIIAGAVAAAGIGVYEGVCFFQDERITDYNQVLAVLKNVAATADQNVFKLEDKYYWGRATIRVKMSEDNWKTFKVKDLYIVNGVLKNRDWGINTTIGQLYQLK